jgi:hypothetical protein
VIGLKRNDKAWVVGLGVLALPLPVVAGWLSDQWSWWLLLFALALLANAAILGLRLKEWARGAVPPVAPVDRAVGGTRDVLDYLFPGSEELRELFRKDLTLAAEQQGNADYGRRLRTAMRADGAGST